MFPFKILTTTPNVSKPKESEGSSERCIIERKKKNEHDQNIDIDLVEVLSSQIACHLVTRNVCVWRKYASQGLHLDPVSQGLPWIRGPRDSLRSWAAGGPQSGTPSQPVPLVMPNPPWDPGSWVLWIPGVADSVGSWVLWIPGAHLIMESYSNATYGPEFL